MASTKQNNLLLYECTAGEVVQAMVIQPPQKAKDFLRLHSGTLTNR